VELHLFGRTDQTQPRSNRGAVRNALPPPQLLGTLANNGGIIGSTDDSAADLEFAPVQGHFNRELISGHPARNQHNSNL
jgi:hypothetical protein